MIQYSILLREVLLMHSDEYVLNGCGDGGEEWCYPGLHHVLQDWYSLHDTRKLQAQTAELQSSIGT